jgi:tellurite resistance protein
MAPTEQEQTTYLANVIYLARADGTLSPRETAVIEEIRSDLGAKKRTLNAALKAAESEAYHPEKVGSFAVQVANLADMLYVCLLDGELEEHESATVKNFCNQTGITKDQLDLMISEAISRLERSNLSVSCPSCSNKVDGTVKFCPNCGTPLGKTDAEAVKVAFEIPSSGYAIEFCESSASGFQAALDFAKSAPNFSSCIRNKKTWYLASWPEDTFIQVARLAELLSGIRNRNCYHKGSEMSWDELFGFAWCARSRDAAYRPVEYCFGRDENRLNPWGCKQARMDWTEWAQWFSYGQFKRAGLLKGGYVWVFDKTRIRHEVMTNLHRFRYCPYIHLHLIDAVLHALPDEIEVSPKAPWKYSRAYAESPGGIKIVEIEQSGGFEFKNEYFADGVRPKGLGILEEVLAKHI